MATNRIPEGAGRHVSRTKIIRPRLGVPVNVRNAAGEIVATIEAVLHRGRHEYHVTPPAGGTVTCRRNS